MIDKYRELVQAAKKKKKQENPDYFTGGFDIMKRLQKRLRLKQKQKNR